MKFFRVSQGRVCIFPFRVLNKTGRRQRKFFENEEMPVASNGRPAMISAVREMVRAGKLEEMKQKEVVVNTSKTDATPEEVADAITDAVGPKICAGITKAGNPCKGKAIEGTDFCRVHQPKDK
jgi:hypothetical protein